MSRSLRRYIKHYFLMHIDSSVVPALSNGELCLYKIHFVWSGKEKVVSPESRVPKV